MESKDIPMSKSAEWEELPYYRANTDGMKCPNCGGIMRAANFKSEVIDCYGQDIEYTVHALCPKCMKAYKKVWQKDGEGV